MPITRQVKNVVKNYSNVEVKVREATSNDPWGPSSSLMAEIADQTYNVVAFSEIMTMIWKRLNDHGKNWRHVYKSLVLLDYILKTGSERVAHQCRENIFSIQTLKDFQFIDRDGKDQGMNVREKSKQLVALLKDEERLKNERTRALKAKERLSQGTGGVGSSTSAKKPATSLRESGSASDVRVERASEATEPTSRSWEPERRNYQSEIEKSRPSNTNEEELQLQLALALSKQEADDTKQGIEKDEKRFQMAVNESRQSSMKRPDNSLLNIAGGGAQSKQTDPWSTTPTTTLQPPPSSHHHPQLPASDPWGAAPGQLADPWGSEDAPPPRQADPWSGGPAPPQNLNNWSATGGATNVTPAADPWASGNVHPPPAADPWAGGGVSSTMPPDMWSGGTQPASEPWNIPTSATASNDLFSSPADPWLEDTNITSNGGAMVPQPFEMGGISGSLPEDKTAAQRDLLSDHSTLVNLDSLVGTEKESNPFFTPPPQQTKSGNNPFAQEKPLAPSLNQLRTTIPQPMPTNQAPFGDPLLPVPLIPTGSSGGAAVAPNNPFL